VTLQLPDAPLWLEGLPHDERGYPVPAEAGWVSGDPVLAKVDIQRKVALGLRRACAICGYQMRKRNLVYRAFGQGDAEDIRTNEREVAVEPAGPAHRSCMLYSAIACPHLRSPTARLGRDSVFEPGAVRGASAAVMGFRDYGLLIYGKPHPLLSPNFSQPQFALLDLETDIVYEHGDSLQDQLAEAVEADAALINTSKRRLYWSGTADDVADLNATSKMDIQTIHKSDPMFDWGIGGDAYVALRL
jgi:hypothetical protein